MPEKDNQQLFTISESATEVGLHKSELTGLLIGLSITPRKAGNARVLTLAELQKVRAAVAKSRQAQPA